jgi:hypothetical protein
LALHQRLFSFACTSILAPEFRHPASRAADVPWVIKRVNAREVLFAKCANRALSKLSKLTRRAPEVRRAVLAGRVARADPEGAPARARRRGVKVSARYMHMHMSAHVTCACTCTCTCTTSSATKKSMNRRSRMASPRDGPGLLLSLPLELREIVWTQATLASLRLSRECCKQFHVECNIEIENVFEREAATRRAAVAVEGDLQQQAGEPARSWSARHIAEQPQPGESGHGWAVRMLFAQRSHSVRTAFAPLGWRPTKYFALWVKLGWPVAHSSSLLFYTYRDETCGSFESRVMTSAKMMLGAHWRLIYAGRRLTDACKLSAYHIGEEHIVHAVPSSRPLRRRTVMKYSS